MNFFEAQKRARQEYGPMFALRKLMHREHRLAIERLVSLSAVVLFILYLVSAASQLSVQQGMPLLGPLVWLSPKLWGVFLIVLSIAFVFNLLEAMYRSYYFRGLQHVLAEGHTNTSVSFEVAVILEDTVPSDITGGFLGSTFGQEVLYRSGVHIESYNAFLQSRTPKLTSETYSLEEGDLTSFAHYVATLLEHDTDFVRFIAEQNINTEQIARAAAWVSEIERTERTAARWWSRDNLGRIPGLGKTWGYGETFLLTRYGHDLVDDYMWSASVMAGKIENDEVEEMEKILARSRQANVLIVGDDVMSARQKVSQLYFKIREGKILPPLEGKRIFFVDLEAIMSAHGDKAKLETALERLLQQSVHAGNVVIYVEYLTAALRSARTLGVDLIDRLLPYLNSGAIHLIAAATTDGLYGTLQRDTRVMQSFDVVRMSTIDQKALLSVLQQRAIAIERATGLVYSVPAIEAVAKLADRYFPTGVMPDKAFDLLEELSPTAVREGLEQIRARDVEQMVAQKTGVPIGEPTKEERAKLLSLEDFLHKRVVGQDKAVEAVAKALRRARAGIGSSSRPMGSFMFLGPTGVGKTETAKALAEALFNDEHAMVRLDMSEFKGIEALEHLMGSADGSDPGRLATLIREQPYGVLLLDEFEKADRPVHDLFLQVLDEGHFTDGSGKSVNAQNLIIIATSNAGADLIWKWNTEHASVASLKKPLVDHIITQGIYRPEFLNRFDDIIVFHPLTKDHVRSIAELQLRALSKHLKRDRMIDVEFADDAVEYIAQVGYDPQFGGRPMRRAIQDKIEQAIADKILEGEIRSGQTFTMHAPDASPKS